MCSDLVIRQAKDPRGTRKPWAAFLGCAGHDRGLKTGKQWLYPKIAGWREHMGRNRVRLESV